MSLKLLTVVLGESHIPGVAEVLERWNITFFCTCCNSRSELEERILEGVVPSESTSQLKVKREMKSLQYNTVQYI